MNDILLIGPYIGDWKNEILTFRPYAKWVYDQLNIKNTECFISSHFNRKFLYDWIPEENFIPVFEQLTRDEIGQHNYMHKSICIKDYKLLVKEFKQKIIKLRKVSIRNIKIYNLSYLESTPHYSWYQKIFTKINVEPLYNDYIIYIPDMSIDVDTNNKIFNNLQSEYENLVMVGDNNCHGIDDCINFQIDYSETGYRNLVRYILGCKFVITPCSHWTFLCNLHHIPVISWGTNGNIYKRNNEFGFDNPMNYILIDNDINKLISSIKYFNRKIDGGL